MGKKLKLFLVTAAMTVGLVFPAAPASAGTCEVANPEVDAVVCGAYFTGMGLVCKVAQKLGGGGCM